MSLNTRIFIFLAFPVRVLADGYFLLIAVLCGIPFTPAKWTLDDTGEEI